MQNRVSSALTYRTGLRDSIPIGLGYLSVSFGFGITAVSRGIPALISVIISLTNLTSAGQVAGVAVIAASGTLIEMALTQLTINLRYSLMSISLSQKLAPAFNTFHRTLAGFGITDEIFAVASSKDGFITPGYMYGLITLPWICWSSGTLLGAVAGNILPTGVKDALGIAIFGMFVAIVIPAAKKSGGVMLAAAAAALCACCIAYLPLLSLITEGFRVIISALLAASAAAVLFPHRGEDEGGKTAKEDGAVTAQSGYGNINLSEGGGGE